MLTAKDLLHKALDYDGFWNTTKRMRDSKSSKCRKSQLDILFKFFEITKKNVKTQSQIPGIDGDFIVQSMYSTSGNPKTMNRLQYIKTLTDIRYFTSGEFIADADRAKYHNLIEEITSTINVTFYGKTKVIENEPMNLVELFHSLYSYRLEVYHLFKYGLNNKMRVEFPVYQNYATYLKNRFMESMIDNLSEFDKVLCLLIDPEQRTIKEDEIDYPTFDLVSIDEEWQHAIRN